MRAVLVFVVAACAASAPPVPHPAAATAIPALAQLEASRDLDNAVVGAAHAPTVVILLASWCSHCRDELAAFDAIRAHHPDVRWLGLNYRAHEEYDGRGNSAAIRALGDGLQWHANGKSVTATDRRGDGRSDSARNRA